MTSCKHKGAKLCAAKDRKLCCDATAGKSCCAKDATAGNSKAEKDCRTGKDEACLNMRALDQTVCGPSFSSIPTQRLYRQACCSDFQAQHTHQLFFQPF